MAILTVTLTGIGMVTLIMVTMAVLIGDGIIRGVMDMEAIVRTPMAFITATIMGITMVIITVITMVLMATIIMVIMVELIQRIMVIISTDRVQDLVLDQDMADIMRVDIQ